MILYFSATGNCEYVAKMLSDNEEILSITYCVEHNIYEFEENHIGIISPTYFWGIPTVVSEFLNKIKIKTDYLFFIATYGTSSGKAGKIADELLNNQIDAIFDVKMPDTWTPIFDLSTKNKVEKFTLTTNEEIEFIKHKIKYNDSGDFSKSKIPMTAVKLWQKCYKKNRQTKNLNVNNNCISCGLCSALCPVNAIEIIGEKPVWTKQNCAMCLSCLHHCPKFAINYKNKTQKHGQYLNSKYYKN